MKKEKIRKTIKVLVIILMCLGGLFLIANYNYREQRQELKFILAGAINGNVKQTLAALDSIDGYSNPIVHIQYLRYKNLFTARFVTGDEEVEPKSSNKIINDICSIYESYWKSKLLKKQSDAALDSILHSNLCIYLVDNKLTNHPYDSLSGAEYAVLEKVIESQGFHSQYFFSNGILDLVIWDQQSEKDYTIHLPNDTLDISVVLIENFLIRGCQFYATFGQSSIGGWTSSEETSLFCARETYVLDSEKYKVHYLKHEANHFIDIKNYINMSPADLEYRSKLVELIYYKKTLFRAIGNWITTASPEHRDHAHPYAEYCLIHELSRSLFGIDFQYKLDEWKEIAPERIHELSRKLLEKHDMDLANYKGDGEIQII